MLSIDIITCYLKIRHHRARCALPSRGQWRHVAQRMSHGWGRFTIYQVRRIFPIQGRATIRTRSDFCTGDAKVIDYAIESAGQRDLATVRFRVNVELYVKVLFSRDIHSRC